FFIRVVTNLIYCVIRSEILFHTKVHHQRLKNSNYVRLGYSETAFVHAITAAGITHSVARACAAGKLSSCSCGSVKGKRAWKWSGCHDNTKFGARFSRTFLDVREKAKDILSFTHLYNNEVGLVRRNRKVHCKCHGMSGSCEIRTCWKAVPSFRHVGSLLVEKLDKAKFASHEVFGNSADKLTSFKPIRKEISLNSPLLYAEQSPTFCHADRRLGVLGTLGRTCNRTGKGQDSCETLLLWQGLQRRTKKVYKEMSM
ncbi:Protein Wnt-4, partial [Armadillidium nasatum]